LPIVLKIRQRISVVFDGNTVSKVSLKMIHFQHLKACNIGEMKLLINIFDEYFSLRFCSAYPFMIRLQIRNEGNRF